MNPKKISFLNAKDVTSTTQGGVGTDGVFRDPWGSPYIVTVDANYDGKTIDAFYGLGDVSRADRNAGLTGLTKVNKGYQANTPVMVWSLGPDGHAGKKLTDERIPNAIEGSNKDNILSWQ